MKYLKKTSWFLMLATVLIASCSEDPDDNTPENVLCDGAGSDSYLPLAMGNEWVYSATTTTTHTVTEVATVGGQQQFTVEVVGLNSYDEVYTVGSNGDVYIQSAGSSGQDTNYLHVPANPTMNQEWLYTISFDGNIVRKVTSLSATVTTSDCTYDNCLEVKSYDGTGDFLYTHYYVRGVGLVRIDYSLFADHNLNSVTLN